MTGCIVYTQVGAKGSPLVGFQMVEMHFAPVVLLHLVSKVREV